MSCVFDKEVQTEIFEVYPYEHLFPVILPQTKQDQKHAITVIWLTLSGLSAMDFILRYSK